MQAKEGSVLIWFLWVLEASTYLWWEELYVTDIYSIGFASFQRFCCATPAIIHGATSLPKKQPGSSPQKNFPAFFARTHLSPPLRQNGGRCCSPPRASGSRTCPVMPHRVPTYGLRVNPVGGCLTALQAGELYNIFLQAKQLGQHQIPPPIFEKFRLGQYPKERRPVAGRSSRCRPPSASSRQPVCATR